jgi:enoyl-CoA hydratase/carnithine racemase
MEDQKILYEVKDKIAWITLNRPESLNAVNREMVKQIVDHCREANEDRNVQIVIFKANGERAFSVGGDIKDRARANAAASTTEPESPLVLARRVTPLRRERRRRRSQRSTRSQWLCFMAMSWARAS